MGSILLYVHNFLKELVTRKIKKALLAAASDPFNQSHALHGFRQSLHPARVASSTSDDDTAFVGTAKRNAEQAL